MDSKNYVPCFHAYFTLITINQGPIPPPRTSHSCVAYKNRYLVVIGGENEETGDAPKKDDEPDVDGIEKRVSIEEDKEEGPKGSEAGDKVEKKVSKADKSESGSDDENSEESSDSKS